jgi:hypothetical protein
VAVYMIAVLAPGGLLVTISTKKVRRTRSPFRTAQYLGELNALSAWGPGVAGGIGVIRIEINITQKDRTPLVAKDDPDRRDLKPRCPVIEGAGRGFRCGSVPVYHRAQCWSRVSSRSCRGE